MLKSILSRLLLVAGQPLAYASTLSGTRFATQWTVYVGPSALSGSADEGLHEFLFYLELDPTALGQGGSVITQRCRLLCDESLTPVRYSSHVAGVKVGLSFQGDEVHVDMPDGSKQIVPRSGAQFLIESNMTGQQALMLALAHERGLLDTEARFIVFVVNSLLPTPYATAPAADLPSDAGRWLRSSHEEELLIGAGGLLLQARTPTQGIDVQRLDPPPPVPAWSEQEVLTLDQPVYTPPPGASFRLEEVVIPGPVTPLHGTLTVPQGNGPFPAVLFLSGSGTHDRHGIAGEIDIGTHEIMDHLAETGYVGLRYDTRGAGKTRMGADALEQGFLSIVADAQAALEYFKGRPEVDCKRIFLIGHSQGGSVALALANDPPELKGIVLMGTIGRGIDEVLIDQTINHCRKLGLSPEQIEAQVKRVRDYVDLVVSERPWVAGEIPDHLFLGARNRKWILEHLRNKPTDLLKAVRCPVLILQAEKDFQVLADKDGQRLQAAAKEAGLDFSYEVLPGLDHLFKQVPGDESRIEQYFDRSRRVDPSLLNRLDAWLRQRSAQPAS